MKRQTIQTQFYNALTLSVAIVVIYYAVGAKQAAIAAPIGVALELITSTYELRLTERLAEKSELNDTLSILHLIYTNIKYYEKSVYASISNASTSLGNVTSKVVIGVFDDIKDRLNLGQDLVQSIASACAEKDGVVKTTLESVAVEYQKNSDAASSIKSAYSRLWREQLLSKEKAYGALQRYLTVSMALSTVLPSFVVFAFVGYSMVYYSISLFFVFSILMLLVLPKLYAMLRMYVVGVYAL